MSVVGIADIVGSRRLDDRPAAQAHLERVIADVERDAPLATQPFRATVGDELQATYPTLDAALAGVLLLRLALPEGLELRFGLGVGPIAAVPTSAGSLQDGPGWWAARDALEQLVVLERRRAPRARTWIVAAPGQDDTMRIEITRAYLLARDQVVGAMGERARRLTYGRCLGTTQRELARREGVTQSAVSQLLATAGAAAIVAGFRAIAPSVRTTQAP